MNRRVTLVVVATSAALLGACGTEQPEDVGNGQAADVSASPSAVAVEEDPAIRGDGTWKVGTDIEPGVYVAEGGKDCQYQWLGDVDAEYLDVRLRGFLSRPVVEITDEHGGFRSEGCGSWTGLESYAGSPTTEMPGDGVWLVGEDVVPGTYAAEGGDWCLWSRTNAFKPDISSVIKGGSDPRATLEDGDLAFVTEGCGSWTKVG